MIELPEQLRPHVLRQYAMLGDGERGAVLGADGHVAWLCAPNWHSEPAFAGLVGGSGSYRVAPVDSWSIWSGTYEPGTLIWQDQWITRDASVHCRQALAVPADPHNAVLLRQVHSDDQPVCVAVDLIPPRHPTGPMRHDAGTWTIECDGLHLRWGGAPDAVVAYQDPGGIPVLRVRRTIPPHSRHDFVLEVSDRPFDTRPDLVGALWERTEKTWRSWTPDTSDTLAPRDTRHAYAVLRGLTSASGGMVAAATTSLPEAATTATSYDYRYAWIRDQCWVGQAVAAHRDDPLLHAAVGFVGARLLADGSRLAPAYTVEGGSVPEERSLELVGYPGGSDRIGNQVTDQFQLDAFGEALLLFAAAARHGALERDTWQAASLAVTGIRERFTDLDAGVWELDDRRWTESRLVCVAGLRAIAAHAPASQASDWTTLADRILSDTSTWGVHPSGRWRRAADDDRIDAALLLAALRGAVPADDPRSVATLDAVREQLTEEGYVYRYRHDDKPLGEAEGAFLVCGFLTALAEEQQGDHAGALRRFERNRSACGPAGLFAEEYDVKRRQLRGNLPQAFVHGLLLEAATRLAR